MISTTYRFIFIHAPKTGGNSVQLVLQPLSDDHRTVVRSQDGHQRFGIEGPITRGKHDKLANYRDRLAADFSRFRIIVGARDPLARAVSSYYSPHRWEESRPAFEREAFEKVVRRMPSLVEMLSVDGEAHRPDHILRFEALADDLASTAQALNLPTLAPLQHVNASAANQSQRDETLADPWVRGLVVERYADDYDLFGYSRPGSA